MNELKNNLLLFLKYIESRYNVDDTGITHNSTSEEITREQLVDTYLDYKYEER